MHHSLRTIQTNNIGHNNVDSVVMPTLASATCLTARQRSPNKTTCWWWVASSVSILITLHKSQCQCQATRLVLARECSRAYKHARCTSEIAWAHLLHTRAFLFVRNGWSSKCLIANYGNTLLQWVTSCVPISFSHLYNYSDTSSCSIPSLLYYYLLRSFITETVCEAFFVKALFG